MPGEKGERGTGSQGPRGLPGPPGKYFLFYLKSDYRKVGEKDNIVSHSTRLHTVNECSLLCVLHVFEMYSSLLGAPVKISDF